MNVLVVAAHPDDEVLGCGGVMARHAAAGDRVSVAIVTRGDASLFPAEQVARLRDELKKAHEKLGVEACHFLDFPAPRLDVVAQHEVADALRQAIRTTDAEVVYAPHRGDAHRDHQLTFQAALVASRPVGDSPVRRLLCYETLSETEWGAPFAECAFQPNVYIDIRDHLQTKLEAMACYESQVCEEPHPRSLASIRRLAELRGNTVGRWAAEAFMLVRHIEC
jgi:LmbE family N-acetylglucosaminyl deacetylase